MTALSASIIFIDNGRGPGPAEIIFGGLATLFFGWATLILVSRVFNRDIVMRIDDQGFWWAPMSDQTIPWPAVDHAWVASVRGRKFISIRLRDSKRFEWKGRFRFFNALNRLLRFGDVTLSVQGLNCSFDELRSAIEHHVRVDP
jgi:hypothetical protein